MTRPNPTIAAPGHPSAPEQPAADPPTPTAGDGSAATLAVAMAWDRACLRARIKDLVDQGHETLIRRHWPDDVPTLKHDGHTDAQLQLILACVRRVETEVGAGWHPDDGPPPHVNTDHPTAESTYPTPIYEGVMVTDGQQEYLVAALQALDDAGKELCAEIAREAHAAHRSINVRSNPTLRRWSIARAVIAWAASGRSVDELWLHVAMLATFEQCRDPSATLGGLISQFTIEQADRLYEQATNQ